MLRRLLSAALALALGAALFHFSRERQPPATVEPAFTPPVSTARPPQAVAAVSGPPGTSPAPSKLHFADDSPSAARAIDDNKSDESTLAQLRVLALTAPAATLTSLLATSPPPLLRHFEEVLAIWAGHAAADALGWLLAHPRSDESENDELAALVLSQWAHTAPTAASSWLAEHPEQTDSPQLRALLHPWLAQDEVAALAWIRSHLQPLQREALLPDILLALGGPERIPVLLENVDPVTADAALAQAAVTLDRERSNYASFLADLISEESVRTPVQARLARRSTPSELPGQVDSIPGASVTEPTLSVPLPPPSAQSAQ
jgi:hypothetical protein